MGLSPTGKRRLFTAHTRCGPSSPSPFGFAVSVVNVGGASHDKRDDCPIQEYEAGAPRHRVRIIFRRRVSGHERKQGEEGVEHTYAKTRLVPSARDYPEALPNQESQ